MMSPAQQRIKRSETLSVFPGRVIETRRKHMAMKGIELARKAGINPRTLDAIEKGRIKSPSIDSLTAIANALGISVASLFVNENKGISEYLFLTGDQKGQETLEFPKAGFRVVCYTPLVSDLFVGKVILKGEANIEHRILPTSGMIFVQVIIGKLVVNFDGKDQLIREGNYTFFNGSFPHSFHNPQFKETAFLLITTPSFLVSKSN